MRGQLTERGWTIVQDVAHRDQLLRLATELGTPVAPAGRPLVQVLSVHDALTAPRKTYSAQYGRSEFPFHTDMANWSTPPHWIILRNAGAPARTPTLVWDVMRDLPGRLLADLRRAAFRTRGQLKSFLCNVVSDRGGVPTLRWDPLNLKPLDLFSADAAEEFSAFIAKDAEANFTALGWMDTEAALVIDNWRVLHARPASADAARQLERVVVC